MIKSYSVSLRISKFYSAVLFLQGKPVNTPDPGVYFRILKEHDVKALFVAPTALRAIRREVSLSKIILFIGVIKELDLTFVIHIQ
jgi:acyl-coenzyme A synthetase/AMP-(fatty) acid ligase